MTPKADPIIVKTNGPNNSAGDRGKPVLEKPSPKKLKNDAEGSCLKTRILSPREETDDNC